MLIPKVIHYVWVGESPKDDNVIKCIESWKKYCPDYEIKEWGNEEYEKYKNKYAAQAYKYKKWAFVADYLRLFALNQEGGIYLDTDVELTQNIDKFLENEFFIGFESLRGNPGIVNTGLIGAVKNHVIIKDFLKYYQTHDFENHLGLDMTPNTLRLTKYIQKKYKNRVKKNNADLTDYTSTIELDKKVMIYPSYYFCTPEEGKENYAIHHFSASWTHDNSHKRRNLIKAGRYILSVFKGENDFSNKNLPIYGTEKVIWTRHFYGRKYFVLIKK